VKEILLTSFAAVILLNYKLPDFFLCKHSGVFSYSIKIIIIDNMFHIIDFFSFILVFFKNMDTLKEKIICCSKLDGKIWHSIFNWLYSHFFGCISLSAISI